MGFDIMAPGLTELTRSRPDLAHEQGQHLLRFIAARSRPDCLRVLNAFIDFLLTAADRSQQRDIATGILHA